MKNASDPAALVAIDVGSSATFGRNIELPVNNNPRVDPCVTGS